MVRGDADWLDAVQTVAIEVHRKYVDPEPIMATLRRHGFRLQHDAGPLDVFTR